MDIYIPGEYERINNPFFDEITNRSVHNFKYTKWDKIKPKKGDIVLIQWPELIFNWNEPSHAELTKIASTIKMWKSLCPILYLVHNEKRHYGMTRSFEKLYRIVEQAANIFIHFANYSKCLFSEIYPGKQHIIIQHPLYERSFSITDKKIARKRLNIPEDRTVLIAPGVIRDFEERSMLLKAFKEFPAPKKSLITPAMKWRTTKLDFKGRTKLKKIVDIKKLIELKDNFFFPPSYYFNYGYNSPEELSLKMSAADAVIIPRIDILNSGNFYLGLSYRKPITGPAKGNLKELLAEFDFPAFDPLNEGSIKEAMKILSEKIIKGNLIEMRKFEKFKANNVAAQWDRLLTELSQNKSMMNK